MNSNHNTGNETQERVKEHAILHTLETTVDEVLAILDADDGKSFEEKKAAMVEHLSMSQNAELSEILVDRAIDEKTGLQIKAEFWKSGLVTCADSSIILRDVEEADRVGYFAIQQDYCLMKSMLSEEVYRDMVWREHCGDLSMNMSIVKDGAYIGYCGIKNTAQDPWEIAIEICRDWTKHGIGPVAISAMLDAIKARLGISEFRVRIDPGNTASQKMFERLGAVPNGISEYLIDDPAIIEQCEENNLHLIDDSVIALAEKFGVAPRKLLSHILEYTLSWS